MEKKYFSNISVKDNEKNSNVNFRKYFKEK